MTERAPTDYDDMSARYDSGRMLDEEGLIDWRAAIAHDLSATESDPVLDLGCGTGMFSAYLSDWFGVSVVGIDPSEGMLAQARSRSSDRVRFVRGAAGSLPLADGSCVACWLSVTIHHWPDLAGGAREVRRVVADGGPVLLRQLFSDRAEGVTWMRFFPEARAVSDRHHPRLDVALDAFGEAGFHAERIESISQVTATSRTDYQRRFASRADSTLAALDEEAYARGVERISEWAAEDPDELVIDILDLVVLR